MQLLGIIMKLVKYFTLLQSSILLYTGSAKLTEQPIDSLVSASMHIHPLE
jgi:hypothetical protein